MRFGITLLLLCTLAPAFAQRRVKIGFVTGPESSRRESSDKFWSFCRPASSPLQLEPLPYQLPRWGAREIANAVCDAASRGARGLIILCPHRLVHIAASFSSRLRLPLVTPTPGGGGEFHLSLHPDTSIAAASLLLQDESESFAFLYDTDSGADQLSAVLELMAERRPTVDGFWRVHGLNDSLAFLFSPPQQVTKSVLAISSEKLVDQIFASIDTSNRTVKGIMLAPSMKTVRPGYVSGLSTLTKFSSSRDVAVNELENRWRTLIDYRGDTAEMPASVVMSHDAIRTMYSVIEQLSPDWVDSSPNGFDCFNYSGGVPLDTTLNMKAVAGLGVTGPLLFGEDGRRTGFTLDITEINSYGPKKIGSWSEVPGLRLTSDLKNFHASPQRSEPNIRVTSVVTRPFLHRTKDGVLEGFVVDLLSELRRVTEREFQLRVVADGKYGLRSPDGKWSGMIGELVDNVADVAIAPLTKTPERAKVVYFGKTFMNVGLSILLYRHPAGQESNLGPFTPLRVWSVWQWIVVALLSLLSAALCYAASRFVGVPDRVRALETKRKDGLSPCGAIWFTCGALLLRDTGIYPRTLTHRLWSVGWWFLCLVLVVFYVSSLSAEVVREKTTLTTTYSARTSQQLLEDLLRKGSPVIGTIRSGSTPAFFRNSRVGLFREYGQYIDSRPEVLTPNYAEGAKRVREGQGRYAFVMESLSAEYEANRPPCDTLVSSGYLATRSYGIAMQLNNTALRAVMDDGVLTLMESGVIRKLYEKWWHNFTDYCEDPNNDILPKVYSNSMTLHETAGVFILLILGAIIAVVAALVENYLASRRMSLLE